MGNRQPSALNLIYYLYKQVKSVNYHRMEVASVIYNNMILPIEFWKDISNDIIPAGDSYICSGIIYIN